MKVWRPVGNMFKSASLKCQFHFWKFLELSFWLWAHIWQVTWQCICFILKNPGHFLKCDKNQFQYISMQFQKQLVCTTRYKCWEIIDHSAHNKMTRRDQLLYNKMTGLTSIKRTNTLRIWFKLCTGSPSLYQKRQGGSCLYKNKICLPYKKLCISGFDYIQNIAQWALYKTLIAFC